MFNSFSLIWIDSTFLWKLRIVNAAMLQLVMHFGKYHNTCIRISEMPIFIYLYYLRFINNIPTYITLLCYVYRFPKARTKVPRLMCVPSQLRLVSLLLSVPTYYIHQGQNAKIHLYKQINLCICM